MSPVAEIAMIDPSTTLRHCAPEQRRDSERHDLGFYHALIEARVPFELLSDQVLTQANLDRFKLIVLANTACLSDAQCESIRVYVGRGGSVVAAYESSLRDEVGNVRLDFGLGDVFGASLVAGPRGIVKNNYIALNGDHPVNAGYDGARRIMGGTRLMAVEQRGDGAAVPFLFVPDFPDLPMEEVYARKDPEGAAVIARETGSGGRVVYFPWNIGEIFWEVMAVDHARLIGNAVRWALGKPPQVSVEGRGVVDMALLAGAQGLALTMLNLTNPMMLKGPVRENFPIGPLKVSIEIPPGQSVGTVRLLVGDRSASFAVEQGRVVVEIPVIERLEVVHVRWS